VWTAGSTNAKSARLSSRDRKEPTWCSTDPRVGTDERSTFAIADPPPVTYGTAARVCVSRSTQRNAAEPHWEIGAKPTTDFDAVEYKCCNVIEHGIKDITK
jgi:hypothetical protein